MINNLNECKLCSMVVILLLLPTTEAQRPSFAGNRPPNGLNQKDKYIPSSSQESNAESRFGSPDASTITNQLTFGQAQSPPVGYPVVTPEPMYTAVTPTRNMPNENMGYPVLLEDRFDKTNINTITLPSLSFPSISTTTQRSTVPLDAHGDKLLIDQLNQIPIDKRPFWFINYQAIEAQRNATVTNMGAPQPKGSFSG